MRLISVRIKNFRCYREEITIELSSLTALIAKNDIGKSSILDALDAFFNKDKLEPDDRSTDVPSRTPIEISCTFSDLPEYIILDSQENRIEPEKEYLLNADGNLEVSIQYKNSTPTLDSVRVIALAPINDNFNDLFDLGLRDLHGRANDLGIDLEGIDTNKKLPIRLAIWGSADPNELNIKQIEIKDSFWKEFKNILPLFQLFKADRPSSDQDPEAQDPIKFAIKESLSQVRDRLEEIRQHVQSQVEEVTRLTIDKIREMDEGLASELEPVIKPPNWAGLFKVSLVSEDQVPLNKRGSGVRRLFLINFLRAKAEQQAKLRHTNNVVFAIEEPETSQHPNNQTLLLKAFRELSDEDGTQVIFTTHNPTLAGRIDIESLRFIDKDEHGKRFIHDNNDEQTLRRIADSLGVFPNHNVKIFVGVEGPYDIEFLRRISKKLNLHNSEIPNLADHEDNGNLIIFSMGGQTLELWANKLRKLNIPELYIVDRDTEPPKPAKYQEFVSSVKARGKHCTAHTTSKREMENYLHPRAIHEALDLDIGSIQDFDDVPLIVAKKTHENSDSETPWGELCHKKQSKKEKRAKQRLNCEAVEHMTLELLNQRDGAEEVIGWLMQIKQHLLRT